LKIQIGARMSLRDPSSRAAAEVVDMSSFFALREFTFRCR
jgi:hypothetical protein